MAAPSENSKSSEIVRITIDSSAVEECPKVNSDENEVLSSKSSDKNISSQTDKPNPFSDKPRDRVLRPSLFLRPSALSGDVLKANSTSSAPVCTPSVSNSKSASPESPVDAMLDVATKSDKTDNKPVLNPVNIPAPSPISNPDYVFGQNMLARVTDREPVSNGTGGLFSAALSAENGQDTSKDEVENKESSSLLEDAARCQEQRATKRKYEEVLVSTGEEDEANVLQVSVKLFAFEGSSWVERGRGTLRLNDNTGGTPGSRIVIRTLGSLRVVLNTKIWPGMDFERANERSIRTTALDASGQLKIFLIQGCATDISSLQTHMEIRLRRCREESKVDRGQDEVDIPKNEEAFVGPEDQNEDEDSDSCRPPKAPVLEPST